MNEPTQASQPLRGPPLAQLLEQLWQQGKQPDPFTFLQAAAGSAQPGQTLPPDVVASVLAVDQWQRWHIGQPVPAEEYLKRWPALAGNADAAVELIYGEFLIRQERGDEPAPQEYLDPFPGSPRC